MINRIKEIRTERGTSQITFARAIGVDRITVWRWENTDIDIPYETLTKIAQYFQVTRVALVPELGEVPPSLEQAEHLKPATAS